MSTATEVRTEPQSRIRRQPFYHVVLLDDDDHTYEYVIDMLQKLFFMPRQEAFLKAWEVDTSGSVILTTTTKEHAEFKRDQIHAFGGDRQVKSCQGAMTAIIEPALA